MKPVGAMIIDPREYIYMSPDGDDTNIGTADYPVKTLQKAIDLASLYGKNIKVKSGTYTNIAVSELGDKVIGGGCSGSNYESLLPFTSGEQFVSSYALGGTHGVIRIVGETTLFQNLSGYTISVSADTSRSYSVLTFSGSPGWQTDALVGKLFSYTDSSGKRWRFPIIKNTANQLTVLGYQAVSFSSPLILDMPEFVLPSTSSNEFSFYLGNVAFNFIKFNFSNLPANGAVNFYVGFATFESCYFVRGTEGTGYFALSFGSQSFPAQSYLTYCLFNRIALRSSTAGKYHHVVANTCCSLNNNYYSFIGIQSLYYCCVFNGSSFFANHSTSDEKYYICNAGGSIGNKLVILGNKARCSVHFAHLGGPAGYTINLLHMDINQYANFLFPKELFSSSYFRGSRVFYSDEYGAALYIDNP